MRLGVMVALVSGIPLLAQVTRAGASDQQTLVSVPFVGCASSGQIGDLEAPKGTSKSIAVSPKDSLALAYYESADGIRLIGPRGWHCMGASGSSGATLLLSPEPTDRNTGLSRQYGPAIEVSHTNVQSSGRYEIAEVMARVFPTYRAFARQVLEGMDLPFPTGPYPDDMLTYRSQTIVEYTTRAQSEGLGTHNSWLKKNDSPIAGAAILVGNPPDLILLSVRLPADLAQLRPAIVRYVERNAAEKH